MKKLIITIIIGMLFFINVCEAAPTLTQKVTAQTISNSNGNSGSCNIDSDDILYIYRRQSPYAAPSYIVMRWNGSSFSTQVAETLLRGGDSSEDAACCMIDSDDAFMAYRLGNGAWVYHVKRWNGSSFSDIVAESSIGTYGNINIKAIDSDDICLLYTKYDGSKYDLFYQVWRWNGSSFSIQVAETLVKANVPFSHNNLCKIDSDDFIFSYSLVAAGSFAGKYQVLRWGGSSFSSVVGETTLIGDYIYGRSFLMVDADDMILFYADGYGKTYSAIWRWGGSSFSQVTAPVEFASSGLEYLDLSLLANSDVMFQYAQYYQVFTFSDNYAHKVNGVSIKKINGVTPVKINGI